MAYIAIVPMQYNCVGFKKKHILTLKESYSDSESETIRKAEGIIQRMKEGYISFRWTVTDDGKGFIGQHNGNQNIYGDYIIHELKGE